MTRDPKRDPTDMTRADIDRAWHRWMTDPIEQVVRDRVLPELPEADYIAGGVAYCIRHSRNWHRDQCGAAASPAAATIAGHGNGIREDESPHRTVDRLTRC